jgi:phage/plasmid-like protein (TIGR03299 family)
MHNIAVINGRASMAYNTTPPWHELGEMLLPEEVVSVQGSLERANLNWNVRKEPIYLKHIVDAGTELEHHALGIEVPGIKAVVRDIDNAILGTVGDRYHLIQNHEAFQPLQYAIDEYGATVETAGALGKGDRVWMLIKLRAITNEDEGNGAPLLREVVPGDVIEPYFLVTNAHTRERSQSLLAKFTPVRVVCQNTLEAALSAGRDASTITIRHTASAEQRIVEVQNLIRFMSRAYDNSMAMYQRMQERDINSSEFHYLLEQIWPPPTAEQLAELGIREEEYKPSERLAREHVTFLFESGNGANLAGSTLWGFYNAITEYVDHVMVMRKDGKKKTNGAMTALFGAGAAIKEKALELCLRRLS